MRKETNVPYKFESLSDLHRALGLPKPRHPMISLINNMDNKIVPCQLPNPFTMNFYKIGYKPNLRGAIRYGQRTYDFDEGGLVFVSPNQVTGSPDDNQDHSGYTLLIDPRFLAGYPLARKIKHYGFFSYATHEALHLSDKEKRTIISIFIIIEEELNSNIDELSQDVMISQLDSLLTYANRFYKRQFITRKAESHDILHKLEDVLEQYFEQDISLLKGLPTVQYLSEQLHLSPSYLSDMLRSLTGQNAQQHIHHALIEKAKEKLATTGLPVSDIAYGLGFEHSQSFSTLFKQKTNVSPMEFRHSFKPEN